MLTAMGDVMRTAYQRGWITTRDGNISVVKKEGKFLYITPTGVRKTIIHPEHIVKLPIEKWLGRRRLVDPDIKGASGELYMHFMIHEKTNETRSVVHLHPTHVVAALHRGFDLQKICTQFPELYRYTRIGPSVPAFPALSHELAVSTAECLGVQDDGSLKYDIVGQASHGVCSVARDPWTAFEHIERLNHICEIVLASGVDPQ
jgi:ribulose-5-phosphate 4-epimerase/fuculose-1-phosphate aldolase